MLNLIATTDKLQLITSGAGSIDVHASFVDLPSGSNPTPVPSRQNTGAINTATTTDIVAAPAASTVRNVKTLHICNIHATLAQDVTVQYNQNGTLIRCHKETLQAGEALEYIEGLGFFVISLQTRKLDTKLRVASDVTNATTSFADITGLTCPVENGKNYCFETHLYHISNATTTGAQFGIGGVTMNSMRISAIDVILGSLTAATMGSNTTDVTAVNTAAMAETTGAATVVMAIMSGWFQPSQTGTFAIRCASEVAVASGLIVKAGSWARVWEADN